MHRIYRKIFKRRYQKEEEKQQLRKLAFIKKLPAKIRENLKEKIRKEPAFSDILLRVYNALGPTPLGACVSHDRRSYMNQCTEVYYDIVVDIKKLMEESGLYERAHKKMESLSDVDEFISNNTNYTLNKIIIKGIKDALDANQSVGPLFKDAATPKNVYEKTNVVSFSYSPSPDSRENSPVKLLKKHMTPADREMMKNIEKLLGKKLPSSPSSSLSSISSPTSSPTSSPRKGIMDGLTIKPPSVSANSSFGFGGSKKSRRKRKTVKKKRRKNKTQRARK